MGREWSSPSTDTYAGWTDSQFTAIDDAMNKCLDRLWALYQLHISFHQVLTLYLSALFSSCASHCTQISSHFHCVCSVVRLGQTNHATIKQTENGHRIKTSPDSRHWQTVGWDCSRRTSWQVTVSSLYFLSEWGMLMSIPCIILEIPETLGQW